MYLTVIVPKIKFLLSLFFRAVKQGSQRRHESAARPSEGMSETKLYVCSTGIAIPRSRYIQFSIIVMLLAFKVDKLHSLYTKQI